MTEIRLNVLRDNGNIVKVVAGGARGITGKSAYDIAVENGFEGTEEEWNDSIVMTDDSRLSDARTPLAHKASHSTGGDDALIPSDIGAASSSHTHPQSDITNLTTDLGNKADLIDGVVPTSQIPSLAINDTYVVASEAAMLLLTAQTGDIAIRTDLNRTFVLQASPASTLVNWVQMSGGSDVVSVNGQTGSIVLGYDDVGAAPLVHTHAHTDITGLGTIATESASSYALLAGATFTGNVNIVKSGVAAFKLDGGSGSSAGPSIEFTSAGNGGELYGYAGRDGAINGGTGTDLLLYGVYGLKIQRGATTLARFGASNNTFTAFSASAVPVIAKMASAATANGFELQNSSSSVLASISAAGKGLFSNVGPTSGNLNLVDSANDIGVQVRTSDVTIPKRIIASSTGTSCLTLYGQIVAASSTTARPSLTIPHGTAPSSPVNGDLWTTDTGMFVHVNGVTKEIAFV